MKRKNNDVAGFAVRADGPARLRSLPAILGTRQKTNGRDSEGVIEFVDPAYVDAGHEPETSRRIPWHPVTFLLLVVLPFLVSIFYYAFVGSDQYIAEARFAVRSLADNSQGNELQGGLLDMRAASQDSYVVTSFIHSTEILKRIEKDANYREIFSRADVDYFSSFSTRGSQESFMRYWKKQVTTYIDGPSGIITLKVRTFRPEDSVKLASLIVSASETLINELSQRARRDIIKSVQDEVEKSGNMYAQSLAALNNFQRESGLLSPEAQALEKGKLLTGLLSKKLELETRQFVMKQSSAEGAPAYEQLSLARQSLDTQIEQLQGELTGSEDASIAKALLRFSELETDRLVAEKLYEASRRTYSAALAESMRKALYLVVFVEPTLPEKSLYPRRVFTPLMTFIALGILWSTLALGWASVQDHRL
ncbi:capsule biosynthesis protein [Ensifer sp. LC163]|nr:capsule biosynthesis protein [Ensifer sp. LC163]